MGPTDRRSAFAALDEDSSRHYDFGFHGRGQYSDDSDLRAALFGAYAAGLRGAFSGLFDMPAHQAWAEANEILEEPGIEWAYRRATSETHNTYGARLGDTEPTDLGTNHYFFTARGSC
jgi:hypothetical protein